MKQGKLYILSTGPGGIAYLTREAEQALRESTVLVGYAKYIDDIASLVNGKETFTSGMTQEIERCNMAIAKAREGKTVSLISNGDINVFGLSSLAVEIINEKGLWDEIEIQSIPGVTAFLAVASKTGAPVSQDFAIISLSDRLTAIEIIENRLKYAMQGDFVLGIYNPLSSRRKKPYEIFLSCLDQYVDRDTPAIVASDIGRQKEKVDCITTGDLIQRGSDNSDVSMSTIILVGNKSTQWTKNKMVLTPRGYLNKYQLDGKIR